MNSLTHHARRVFVGARHAFVRARHALPLLFILILSCSYQVSKDPMTLVWHLGSEPDSLNPITGGVDAYAARIHGLINSSLVSLDNQTLDWVPEMAHRWEISKDHMQFTFYLREGIRWHDGHPFTVDDIIYAYEKIQDPTVDAAPLRVYYRDMEKVEKIDDLTVKFTFKRPYFRALDFCSGLPLLPKHLLDDGQDFNTHPMGRTPVGVGPYKFSKWITGERIILVRNEDYWGKQIDRFPDIRQIDLEFIADNTVAIQVLKKGDLDYAGLRPIQWLKQTSSKKFNEQFAKYQFYTPSYSFIGWNSRKPFFSDKRVRWAMTMLTNRTAVLEKLNFGIGRQITGPFYYDFKDYNKEVPLIPYDPEGAKGLLKSAGWEDHDGDGILDKDGIPFQFEFMIPSGTRASERIAGILKEDLKKVGIQLEIRKAEWALFSQRVHARTFDAVVMAWVVPFRQDPYQLWHSSQAEKGSNYVGFSNKRADQIIELARKEFNGERRSKLYQEFHSIVHQEQPYTFLFSRPHLVALNRRFTNVKVYPVGMDTLEWKVNPVARMMP